MEVQSFYVTFNICIVSYILKVRAGWGGGTSATLEATNMHETLISCNLNLVTLPPSTARYQSRMKWWQRESLEAI